jgi:phage baseplate assembly protein W
MRVSEKTKRVNNTIGISVPIKLTLSSGIFETSKTSIDQYKSNLYVAILTGIGTRVMNPDFGSIVPNLMFEQMSDSFYDDISNSIKQVAAKYTPQLNVGDIDFINKDNNQDNNKIEISIDISLMKDSSITENLRITL